MRDRIGRNIDYMRISITDRCNLRCRYCMPDDIALTDMSKLLTYEEIVRIAREGIALGITNYRLTGGEPLVRRGCEQLIGMLRSLPGMNRITLTTNGVLLAEKAKQLKEHGLNGVNVSLDTLEPREFLEITQRDELEHVLKGIDAARAEGLPVKVNTVLKCDTNWRQLLAFGEQKHIPIRFIELMPIGHGRDIPYVSNDTLLRQLEQEYGPALADEISYGQGPARYYRFPLLSQPVGVISAMDHQFCGNCNRIRLTSEGFLKLCLCYNQGLDLRSILRNEETKERLGMYMQQAIWNKPAQHIFHDISSITEAREMVRIGG